MKPNRCLQLIGAIVALALLVSARAADRVELTDGSVVLGKLVSAEGGKVKVATDFAGTFKGWSGRTLFRLENGQSWVQADTSDSYWVTPQPGPEVEVRQSGIGGWKLFLGPNGRWVRVKRVN